MPATSAFLKLAAQKIGEVKTPVRVSGLDNLIKIIAVKHEIISPRDIATAQATGKRQHHPIILTKEVDNTTPLLNQLLIENLTITQATIIFFGTDPGKFLGSGSEMELYNIILKNAFVSRIELTMPEKSEKEKPGSVLVESISINYTQIEWIWKNGGIAASDSLNANK